MNEAIIILISLAIGSFGNNVISYYSGSSKFDISRSGCQCGKMKLSAFELIPLISYMVLRGKCRHCSARIALRYPVVEAVSVILGLLCLRYYNGYDVVFYYLLLFCLFVCGVIDYLSYRIPNIFIILFLLLSVYKNMYIPFMDIVLNTVTGIVVSSGLLILNKLHLRLRKADAIGYGDIKLIFSLSLLFSYFDLLTGIWISAIIALAAFYIIRIFKKENRSESRIPYGFYLSVSFIIISIIGDNILRIFIKLVQPEA